LKDLFSLPLNLPVPQDDGQCDHLTGTKIANVSLQSTAGRWLDLKLLTAVPTIVFFYPRTGEAHINTPDGWDDVPGARGCTPQSCGFRDLSDEFKKLGFQVFGLSTQTTNYQQEFAARMHIPFEILSDSELLLTKAMTLPTFKFNNETLIKRMAWVLNEGRILKVFYPVFPSNENASTVLDWIKLGHFEAAKKRFVCNSQDEIEVSRGPYLLSNQKELLDPEFVHKSLKRTHWSAQRSLETVKLSLQNSDVYAVYLDQTPIAFARVVTDSATFAYLCDVFVVEEHRGHGHSKWIMDTIVKCQKYQKLRRFVLATLDAHSLYQRYGFQTLSEEAAARFMEIRRSEF
jgi:peroxiredoxin/GNAT superfamily N-acetyltransferase